MAVSETSTFAYQPGVKAYIFTANPDPKKAIVDVSEDITRGQLTLTENQPHQFQIALANHYRKYDYIFTPNDRVVIWMRRIQWLQVFAGYLDAVPYFSAYPSTVQLTGTCTLKKLKYWAWDPNIMNSQLLLQNPNNAASAPASTDPTQAPNIASAGQWADSDPSGGLTQLIINLLTQVAEWDQQKIHIGDIPKDWLNQLAALLKVEVPFLPNVALGGGSSGMQQGGATGTLTGNGNVQKAFNFFVQQGLPPASSAGIVGNMMQEASPNVDPEITGTGGCGIIGWTPCSKLDPACRTGNNDADLLCQLNSVWNQWIPQQGGVGPMQSCGDPGNCAVVWANTYEHCGDCRMNQRIAFAQQVFNTFGNQAPPAHLRKGTWGATTGIDVGGTTIGTDVAAARAVPVQVDRVDAPGIADAVESAVGTPYMFGAQAPGVGFDGPSLTQWAVRQGLGIDIGRDPVIQYNTGVKVDQRTAQRGDLVFFFGDDGVPNQSGVVLDGPPATMMAYVPGQGSKVQIAPIPSAETPVPAPGTPTVVTHDAPRALPKAGPQGYTNPLAQAVGLTPERVDQGVDYSVSGDSPLLALGNGVIKNTTNAGWPGGGFVALQLSDGPYMGNIVYYAEHLTPLVNVGDTVTAGNAICTLHPGFPNLEIGWGGGGSSGGALGASLAASNGPVSEGTSTACGVSFNNLLVSLGAPSGQVQGTPTGTCPIQVGPATPGFSNPGSGGGAPGADSGLLLNYIYTIQEDVEANQLTGVRALLNDSYLLQYLQPVVNAAMRSFCSAPNGDFIAWFPDYFGMFGAPDKGGKNTPFSGVMEIEDIEIQDFSMVWDDTNLVTHMFTAGSESPVQVGAPGTGGAVDVNSIVNTYGVATVDFPQLLYALFNIDPDKDKNSVFKDTKTIENRFGARPYFVPMGEILLANRDALFWYACRLFMENWTNQFSTNLKITFMPELYPGMIVRLKSYQVQFYVRQVTHTWDYSDNGGGFTTQVVVTAPAATDGSGLIGVGRSGPRTPA